jgi:transposase
MEHYAGLDVSVKETSVCVVDGAGQVMREVNLVAQPWRNMSIGIRGWAHGF